MFIETRKPILAGVAIFLVIAALTQYLTYQQYLINEQTEFERISAEANTIADRLNAALSYSLSATKTLAFLVEEYGVPEHFDSVAADILESNKFIDALELTRKGVITHIYPGSGNSGVIGYDVLADSSRNREALKALARKELYFAGPLELRQGGTAVVGRLPVFRDTSFFGFSVVIIRLPTLLKAAGIDEDNTNFIYQLSKRHPSTGKEEFFLNSTIPSDDYSVAVEVPGGEWNLYVIPKVPAQFSFNILSVAFLGWVLSLTAGLFGWHFARQPQHLRRRVHEVTTALSAYQEKATRSLQRVNRFYHFTSRINHMMVHTSAEGEIYQQVCEIAYEIGQFKLAWIGIIDEARKKIVPVYGADGESISDIEPFSIEPGAADGPATRMLRTGSYVHCNDITTDPLMKHSAGKGGYDYRSYIILPIRKFDTIIGSLNLYSREANTFDEKEIQLLAEATSNISFTLENIEKERMRRLAEDQIQSEKTISDSIINSLPGIFYLYNRDGKFIRWNKNFEIVSGYSGDQIRTMHPLDFFDGHDRELLDEKINNVFRYGYDDVVAEFYTKENERIPYFFNGRRITFDSVDYLIGMGLDMTDQVRAERALRERAEEIEKLSAHLQDIREEERSRIALQIHDVLGQQLTALKMDSTWLKKKVPDDPGITERISSMILLIDDTIKTVRRISSELRPGILDDLGLIAALEWQGAEFKKNTGIALHFETNTQNLALDRNLSTNVFRIFQEALTNVARHAHAKQVLVRFSREDDHIQLTVEDNGEGIDLDEVQARKSIGMVSMKARARMFGGEVMVKNIEPHGTAVILKIPQVTNVNHNLV